MNEVDIASERDKSWMESIKSQQPSDAEHHMIISYSFSYSVVICFLQTFELLLI